MFPRCDFYIHINLSRPVKTSYHLISCNVLLHVCGCIISASLLTRGEGGFTAWLHYVSLRHTKQRNYWHKRERWGFISQLFDTFEEQLHKVFILKERWHLMLYLADILVAFAIQPVNAPMAAWSTFSYEM